ncbi:MAG: isoaspartyl peptidase/L-asparaginase [Flavobacteriaceae bacterium]|nr:isoaspartyl peptidase/L-asparaginase [Flavobacteriaceae bacterium]
MKRILLSLAFLFLLSLGCETKSSQDQTAENTTSAMETGKEKGVAIVIHGGAGTIKKENMTAEQEVAYRTKLQEALDVGYKVLEEGGTSLDAVQKAINVMEDSPLFNAGKGAVFNSLGKNELDASIMDGKTLNTGAIAGVKRIKNPINAARIVMDSTHHVMMAGKGAEDFAKMNGIEFVDDNYFHTDKRYNQLLKAQEREKVVLDHSAMISDHKELIDDHKYGTVGAVALDKEGNIAAATSTGGMTNKKYGRVGDVPIIGAGTYANNNTCGISATGTGEYFIRTVATHETSSLMKYKNLSLKESLDTVIKQVGDLGGSGGMVGLDKDGNVAWSFNSAGMYRGFKKSNGENVVKFYEE